MIPAKQKVQLRTKTFMDKVRASASDDAEALVFPPPAPLPALRPLKACAVCGAAGPRAHPDHDVCQRCAGAPDAIRARLATQRAILTNAQRQAAQAAEEAWRALTDEEQARWAAFQALRDAEALSPDDQRRLAATLAAYSAPAHPRISDALRRYYHAAECLFWANAAEAEGTRRLDIKIAQLNVCIEDLEDQ